MTRHFAVLRRAHTVWQTWWPPLQGMPNPFAVLSHAERKDWSPDWHDCIRKAQEMVT